MSFADLKRNLARGAFVKPIGKIYRASVPGDWHIAFFYEGEEIADSRHKATLWYRDGRLWASCKCQRPFLAPFRAAVFNVKKGGRKFGFAGFDEPAAIGDVIEVDVRVEGVPQ